MLVTDLLSGVAVATGFITIAGGISALASHIISSAGASLRLKFPTGKVVTVDVGRHWSTTQVSGAVRLAVANEAARTSAANAPHLAANT